MPYTTDIAIIGGGPAGAAAAIRLARAGRDVALFERSTGNHHKVCGEFLEASTIDELRDLDIDPLLLGATNIDTLAVIHGARWVETGLRAPGMALTRQVLDAHLLDRAAKAGAVVHRGVHVAGFEYDGREYRIRSGDAFFSARHLFIATGKHDLRAAPRIWRGTSDHIGFKLHMKISEAARTKFDGRVVLVAFRGGYAGLLPIDTTNVNLCLVLRRALFDHAQTSWEQIVAKLRHDHPALADLLRDAEPSWQRPLAIGRVPYGYIRNATDGPWWLGDQAAVIPSLTGAGVGIALQSARLASDGLLARITAQSFQRSFADQVGPVIRRSLVLSRVGLDPRMASAVMPIVARFPGVLRLLQNCCSSPRQTRDESIQNPPRLKNLEFNS